jgi:hypothetical protein
MFVDIWIWLTLIVALLLIAATLAPLETLAWWVGWDHDPRLASRLDPVNTHVEHFVVYLSGVAQLSGKSLVVKEQHFLNLLEARLPKSVIVRDVFPFSVTNTALTERRPLAWFWKWSAHFARGPVRRMFVYLVQIRNILQVAVSADRRYGTMYSMGVAQEIIKQLLRYGYSLDAPRPITLICISGGAQISVGVAPILHSALGVPIYIISVGGVLTDDPGILYVETLYHLSGSADRVQYLGDWLYPGRWPIFPRSPWNRARNEQRIVIIDAGPMKHMGQGDYFSRSARLPDGRSHVEWTLDTVVHIMEPPAAP